MTKIYRVYLRSNILNVLNLRENRWGKKHSLLRNFTIRGRKKNKVAAGEKVTRTILVWFQDKICHMHFRRWDGPKNR